MTIFKKKNLKKSIPKLQELDDTYRNTIMKLSIDQRRHYCKNLLVQSALDLSNMNNSSEEESIRVLIFAVVEELEKK